MTATLTPNFAVSDERISEERSLIGPADNGRLMTPEEFDALTREDVEEGYSYELIHGVLIVNAAAGPHETDPNGQLEFLLRLYDMHYPGVIDKTLYEAE